MRNSVMVFVIIILFCLPGFTMGGEVFSVKPFTSIAKQLNSKNRKDYRDFCRIMTNHLDELDALFRSDTSKKNDPDNAWQKICDNAQNDIIVAINSDIGLKNKEAGEWYGTLVNLFSKFKTEGANTFNAKVKLDRLIVEKNKSLKDLKIYKDVGQKNILYFDKFITLAIKYREERNINYNIVEKLKRAEANAYNTSVAYKEYGKDIIAAVNSDNPSLFNGKENHLSAWAIKGEDFENLKIFLTSWQLVFVEQHKKYKKLYKVWTIESSWIFDDSLFQNTDHMKGWTWQNFYNNYMKAAKIWEYKMEQHH